MDASAVDRLNAALEGRYRIERALGQGGMATVYLAEDVKHHRKVALKVLRPELAAVVGAERFLSEIEVTAGLQHPHILPLFDSGEADSFLFFVMPYIEGYTLRDRLDREKQLPVEDAVRIASAVASALQAAHDHGVIHRDIKPSNILLSRGEPLVSDFGISLAVTRSSGERLTETGLSVGTPYYMSPEQATGDRDITAATDVYSLGCVLYEMLVGDPPYIGSTAQAVLGKIIQGLPVSATAARRAVPRNVDAAIRKALEKLPADRFVRADDFAEALVDPTFRHGEADATATGRTRVWKPLALAAAASTLALAGALIWSSTRPAPPEPVARFESPFREGQAPVAFGLGNFRLSRDGSMLVYVGPGPDGSGTQLWVRRWDDLESVPLRSTVGATEAWMSPDGSALVFSQDGGVRAMALDGGPVRELGAGSAIRWLDDGYVYFRDPEGDAKRVLASGGSLETVSARREGEATRLLAQLLPGGRGALVVVQFFNQPFEAHALDLRTGESRRLVAPAPIVTYSATGHLVYLSDGSIMAAPFDPGRMELLGPGIPLVEGVTAFSLSSSGTLAYGSGPTADGTNSELVWITREGEATPVEEGWMFTRGAGNAGWSLSPDGTRIAVRQIGPDGNSDIWIKELPGGPLRRLTFEETEQRVPFWTPDGAQVTYFSVPADPGVGAAAAGEVWRSGADGTGGPELVSAAPPGFAQGVWSPDGAALVLRTGALQMPGRTPGSRDLILIRPDQGSVTVPLVTTPQYAEQDPSLSPDGRWLAYTSNETGRNEVFVRPFPEVDAAKVQVSSDGGVHPFWSRDGRELFYVDGGRSLVSVRFDAGPRFRVTAQQPLFAIPTGYVSGTGIHVIDVAPDGERFLFGRSVGSGDPDPEDDAPRLVIVFNFDEELRRRVPR